MRSEKESVTNENREKNILETSIPKRNDKNATERKERRFLIKLVSLEVSGSGSGVRG